MVSKLVESNRAYRAGDFANCIRLLVEMILRNSELSLLFRANLYKARQKYLAARAGVERPKVGVCGWELSHNAAGRVHTLATIYGGIAQAEIIGAVFKEWGSDIWPPVKNDRIRKNFLVVEAPENFLEEAISFVSKNPYDVIHLSKPRAPNILFGILYKLIWGAKVLMDIDDEELSFVGVDSSVKFENYLDNALSLPGLEAITDKEWTQIAVDLAGVFDGVTVSNEALQARYGGAVIAHARDGRVFRPMPEARDEFRKQVGIPLDAKVLLFFGTPRRHKGLLEVAAILNKLNREDVFFLIIGDFPDGGLEQELKSNANVKFVFLGNQAFGDQVKAISAADACLALLDRNSKISQFQIPAKLSDGLACGAVTLVSDLPPLQHCIAAGAVVPVADDLESQLIALLDGKLDLAAIKKRARDYYTKNMVLSVNSKRLRDLIDAPAKEIDARLIKLLGALYPQVKALGVMIPIDLSNPLGEDLRHALLSKPKASLPKPGGAKGKPVGPVVLEPVKKLPITALVISWDIGHNPLGRSYMLAEVVQRVARHTLLVGFQFPRYGEAIWEPVREGRLPVISLPGNNLPEFHASLEKIAERIKPDVVIACKPRLPSVQLGMMIKEKWGCPLIVDVDDHELSFFKNQEELNLDDLKKMTTGSAPEYFEPYSELWTRLTQTLCKTADDIIVSNTALQREFGGTIVAHVRDENNFDPANFDRDAVRKTYGVPLDAKIVLFFGTPRAHKGIDTLARAVQKINDPKFKLLVVGTPPDRSVTAKLDSLAPNKVLYLPNQPFSAIPEILSMADVVCLPQDEGHAISQYQLPAKAIDAIAMGVPLLVSNTPPLMMLVNDGVAEVVGQAEIPQALERLAGDPEKVQEWKEAIRPRFLKGYSYHAASLKMKEMFQRCLARKKLSDMPPVREVVGESLRLLGLPAESPQLRREGADIVVFWKQNDTGLYGRRHDMVIKYLAAREDIRKVIVFDAPISEYDLIQKQQANGKQTQDRSVYVVTYEKILGKHDTPKLSYNVFVTAPGAYRSDSVDPNRPTLLQDYTAFIRKVLEREGVEPANSIFWVYPKNFLATELVKTFGPKKLVVDVVDDHRAWPGVSDSEKALLTDNYRELLAAADMSFCNCEPVQASMKEFDPAIRLVPNGCDSLPPSVQPKHSSAFKEFSEWKGKIIGFIGNLESKIDIELLEKIAVAYPDALLVLIGSTHANPAVLTLKRYSNVRMPGVVPYNEAGAWVSRFNVGLVPHLKTELTKSMNPLKVFMYLAFGVPVISTEVDNVDDDCRLITIARDHQEFVAAVGVAVQGELTLDADMAKSYVEKNSWESRFEKHVDDLLY